MTKLKRSEGFAHHLLLPVFVLVLTAGAGYWVWRNQTEKDSEVAFTPAPSQPCEGERIDTHAHMDQDHDFSRVLAERMRAHQVGCSLLFTHVDLNNPRQSMLAQREEMSPNPGRFILFADFIENDLNEITRAKLDAWWRQQPDTYKGLGEFAFYRPPIIGSRLSAEPWPTLFEFAAEHDLVIMLHLTPKEKADFESLLQRYPDTKVLIHHREFENDLPTLLKKYSNLYYTLDTTNLLTLTGGEGEFDNVLMYPKGEGNAHDFLKTFRANRTTLLSEATKDWLPVFEAAPDRVMWGTDVSLDWHIEPEPYKELVDFSKDFAAKLPQEYRQKYMFENALNLFGPGITLEALSEAELDDLDSFEED